MHALDAAGPEVQRAVALLAPRRACETARLTDVWWVAKGSEGRMGSGGSTCARNLMIFSQLSCRFTADPARPARR
ncbi:hypothetical protein GCM10009663_60090 [Kitasatospora arboriphila]|uniref:Uncharacterized protein n=1 Tax=Kitasatospora arboriphila TaxID=258052 RepID=A0ABN1TZR7_9ACTN